MYTLRNKISVPSSRYVFNYGLRYFHSSKSFLKPSFGVPLVANRDLNRSPKGADHSVSSSGKMTRRIASVDKATCKDPNGATEKFPYIAINLGEETLKFSYMWLRDACPCSFCIDQSTTQKRFQTTDIPRNLDIHQVEDVVGGGIRITWMNDLPHYNAENKHTSVYDNDFFERHTSGQDQLWQDSFYGDARPWNAEELDMLRIPFQTFMEADHVLYDTLRGLVYDGLIMIKGVPSDEDSVELVAKRVGNLRDTFYGRTWNVKSIPQARNVAYTSTYLGLHMDLLYMREPPGLQLLHCLGNTCNGGTALFSDTFKAAKCLSLADVWALSSFKTAYHYHNDNEHYFQERPTLEYTEARDKNSIIKYVNWSPPFQASYAFDPSWSTDKRQFAQHVASLRKFARLIEAPANIYRYNYEVGDCVIFNNRRILHGREAFNAEGGERWLKGAYVDTDVFHSRLRVLAEQFDKT